MHTNADGLGGYGKELKFKDRTRDINPDIVGTVETKLVKKDALTMSFLRDIL